MFSLEEQQRLAINQLPQSRSYEYVVHALTGFGGIKEPCRDNIREDKPILFVRNGKIIPLKIDVHFDYCLIMFDISPFMKTRDMTLFKLGSIMYRWLVDFGASITNVYEGLLEVQEDYMLQNIEEQSPADIEGVEYAKGQLDEYLEEKQVALTLHKKLLLRYDNLGISKRQWREQLALILKKRPQYARLIASFLSLMQYEKYELHKDFCAFDDSNHDRYEIPPMCYIPSEVLDNHLQQESECGYDYFYSTIGKNRKVYSRLNAFCIEFNKL